MTRQNDPFRPKQLPPISAFEAMRKEIVRNPVNADSIVSTGSNASSPKQYPPREKFITLNAFEDEIPAYSIFAVKKSEILNRPPEPEIPVEAFKFEFGLVYVTNGEFAIQSGDDSIGWTEVVDSFPVRIRYDQNDTVPKIGHILGPNGEGKLTSKQAGFVVIAEPDTENYLVWVCKSNDQSIRVKVQDNEIKPNQRGKCFVVGEDLQQITEGQPVNAPAHCKASVPKEIDDPNKIDPSPRFELPYVLNLTKHRLVGGEIYLARPVLGLGIVIYDDSSGLIEFLLLEDRVRDENPEPVQTKATVIAVLGRATAKIGDQVLLNFPTGQYYGAVKDCRGYALWFPEKHCAYTVILCQELDYWISFQTTQQKPYSQQPIKIDVDHKKRGSNLTATFDPRDWSAWDHTVTFDEQFKYPLPAGLRGKAILDVDALNKLDNSTMAYHVVSVEQSAGKIAFKMLTDRTREIDQSGLYFGRANVVIQDIVGIVPHTIGSTVEVIFPDRLYLGAVTNCEGTAEYYASNNKYIVDESQELAAWISFDLLTNRNISAPLEDLPITIAKSGGFANAVFPPDYGYVRFRPGEFPLAKTGAQGWAILDVDYMNVTDNTTMRYYVVQCNQMSPLQMANTDKFCPGENAAVNAFAAMFYHPFGQTAPAFQNALNPLNLASLGGDAILSWNHSILNWVVLNAEHSKEKILTGIKQTGCKIAALYREFAMMTCEDVDINGCTAEEELPSYCVEFQEFTAYKDLYLYWDYSIGCGIGIGGTPVNFCALGSGEGSPPGPTNLDSIEFEERAVVVDVLDDGDCAYAVYALNYFPPCGGDEYDGNPFICIVECPNGSGGGSG